MSLYSSRLSGQRSDGVSGLNKHLDAQRRLSIALSSAQILHASSSMVFGECAFWKVETKAAKEIFVGAQKASVMQPGFFVASKLAGYTQKLIEMKERWKSGLERFAILKDFEQAYERFEGSFLEARELIKGNDPQYAGSKRWQVETEALRERQANALSIVRFKEDRYMKVYNTCSTAGMQTLADRIKKETGWIAGEMARLDRFDEQDAFYPLRCPDRIFGKLSGEIGKSNRLVKRLLAEYGDVYRGNKFWLSEINGFSFQMVNSAIEELGKCKRVALDRADRETLSAMDEKLQDLSKKLSSARKRFEVMAEQNIFGLLADREKASKLLQKYLSEFEELLFTLDRRYKRDYSWAMERKKLDGILNEADQALKMAEEETIDRNKLMRAVTRLESKTSIIRKEMETLKSLTKQKEFEDNEITESFSPKPNVPFDEFPEAPSAPAQSVAEINDLKNALQTALSFLQELQMKINRLDGTAASEKPGGNGKHRRAAHDSIFVAPES